LLSIFALITPSALTISAITFAGVQGSDFSLVTLPNFPLILASNATQQIMVQLGLRSATLTIASGGVDAATARVWL